MALLKKKTGTEAPAEKKKRPVEEDEPTPEERKLERKARRKLTLKRLRITLIILAAVIALAAAGGAYWGYMVTNNGVIGPQVYASGVNLSGMTYEQAVEALGNAGWDEAAATPLTVTLPKDITSVLDRTESGVLPVKEDIAARAYAWGHDGNWYRNLLTWLENHLDPVDVYTDADAIVAGDYIMAEIALAKSRYEAATADGSWSVDEKAGVLTMIKGGGEVTIDDSGLYTAIVKTLLSGQTELNYDTLVSTAQMPDFSAIYDELAVEPADAYFDSETKEVVPSVEGFTFDISEAERLWNEAELTEEVRIPVQTLAPEVTTDDLNAILFADVLGEKTTYYYYSSDSRINNIDLAASKINGVILCPGETFSYNETVGRRTTEAGFEEAAAYSDGEVVQEVGGGICQVSSTLYCTMMLANLKTVSRAPHYFPVDYINLGWDATVSWPNPDFKFSNNRDYPIKIVAYTDRDNKELTIQILGTDVDHTYVELGSYVYTIYDDIYPDVAVGYGVQAYRRVYDEEGNYIQTINEIYDVYHFHDYDIDWPEDADPETTTLDF